MKTQLLTLSLAFIACAAAGLRAQNDASPAPVAATAAALERKIEQVLYRADAPLAATVDAELAAALKAEPRSAELRYLQGFATYAKTSLSYRANDMKAVRAALEESEKQLAAVKEEPWKSEATALRGMIAGQLISVRGGASAMTLGPRMRERTEAAFEALPQSPRVLICHGVMFLNTPGMFGGDKDEALRLIKRAVAAYEKSPEAAPRWGRAWALGWLAQASLQTGDLTAAREAATQALAIEPEYVWVKTGLLPAIEEKAARK
jgi:tetratricopeptide (TPR) repeat protein